MYNIYKRPKGHKNVYNFLISYERKDSMSI